MEKENKRSFFSWVGWNRQKDDVGSEPASEREINLTGIEEQTDNMRVPLTNVRDAGDNAEKEGLSDPKNYHHKNDDTRLMTTQVSSRRSDAVVSYKTLLNSTTSTIKNDFVVKPREEDGVALLFGSTDAPALENHNDASVALTLSADLIVDKNAISRSVIDGLPPGVGRGKFFSRLKNSLAQTRKTLGSGLIKLFLGKKIDNNLFEALEEQLLVADVGIQTTRKIIDGLIAHAGRGHLKDAEVLYSQLRKDMAAILANVEEGLKLTRKAPFVILMVGVNGVGKTTTIGKLARQYQTDGKRVMLAAGDTFRAAAVEQLQAWGERNEIPVVAKKTGADSASVIFDALQSAKAREIDVLIADTAGRLQNKTHLMDELKKIVRVIKKLDVEAPHEVMLILDASTGQNAISQTHLFNDALGLTGIALTKLDGTAKGGVIFSVAERFGIPIRYISIGEHEDLQPFKASDFIEALFR
ncbi:signal recognition particle-docking protein FtsY [secondary endosymbiont of Ctenarytaina eucalypti]|uniref:Signal recognition particle receptor FtsY n=1 Tax=secondary endosymbiont of Ctenarytaina eucalypti TaxID=1199245 RepID=J3VT48_9ENTR|nr:signal recognition particle-docking protein FtsY [secondary endosymbiont of Ctenarytaina eucalypti]AFP85141.1 signal recognition particle-docking protein FtsY [secondary endosymbiont of Ctenarytaina eucalypti]